MTVRTNLALNPRPNGTNNWLAYAGTGATSTVTNPSTGGPTGSYYLRQTWTVAASAGDGNWGTDAGTRPVLVAGTVYTTSVWIRSSVARSVQMYVHMLTSGASVIASYGSGAVSLAANTWTQISVANITAPALTTQANVEVRNQGANFAVGNTYDVALELLEAAASVGTYFDGSSTSGGGVTYAWTGTANASSSTATTVSPPSITATVDLVNRRIGVQVNDFVAVANGPITVYRVHADTTEWRVRALTTTSGGAAFAWDYEAPFNQPVYYYAFDGSTRIASTTVTLGLTYALLRAPGLPGNDATITPLAKNKLARPRPAVTLDVLGRETPIGLSDTRKSARFTLMCRTKTDTQAAALLTTLGSSTCLLEMPGDRIPWAYVQILNVEETPEVDYRPPAGVPADHISHWSTWKLDCVVTDQPVGGIYGDPTASYQAIKDTYATYTALRTAKASYLDVLKGI